MKHTPDQRQKWLPGFEQPPAGAVEAAGSTAQISVPRPPAADPALERIGRAFGRMAAGLHERGGGDPQAAAMIGEHARQVWIHAAGGHVCIDVTDPRAQAALAASPAVADLCAGSTREETPLVLDGDALYLRRLWRAEDGLARAIHAFSAPAPLSSFDAMEKACATVFISVEYDRMQHQAIMHALTHRLTLLSGGPGTGKTATLARVLVAFARLAPDARVVFAAPTGKAAARLASSLADALERLDPTGSLRSRLPQSGTTVHRLLGWRADHEQRPARMLDHDLVMVDEASMLDVELAAALTASIGPDARLVLAGDHDQLASVEAGAVFADLCAGLPGQTVHLKRNFRQQDAAQIVALANRFRALSPASDDAPAETPPRTLEDTTPRAPEDTTTRGGIPSHVDGRPGTVPVRAPDPAAIIDEARSAWSEAARLIRQRAAPESVLAACERHRILCALRAGATGVLALNRRMAAIMRGEAGRDGQASARGGGAVAAWYPGRLVLVTVNRPVLGLFNGDVGICLERPGRPSRSGSSPDDLLVFFADANGVRSVPVFAMPACEDAWAMTIHKSQGSEFESVALVLGPAGHRLHTRELVYTGITRARSRLSIWAPPQALERAADVGVARRGRLRRLLLRP